MIVVTAADAMQEMARAWHRQGRTVGFVPTMGYLHAGHLSLVQAARDNGAEVVVLSIFVNPTQFGPTEDLSRYPRDLDRDLALCRTAGVDVVFTPEATAMYCPDASTWVEETAVSLPLCGRSRPGHFRGVTTVVAILFNLVLPDIAVFGQKDAQQALVIGRMVRDLRFPVRVVVAPIVREPDGLAMSSRNVYLSAADRGRAVAIHRGLDQARQAFRNGETDAARLVAMVRDEVTTAGGRIDYVALTAQDTLAPLTDVDRPALLAVAAFFGQTRLIDNVFLAASSDDGRRRTA